MMLVCYILRGHEETRNVLEIKVYVYVNTYNYIEIYTKFM